MIFSSAVPARFGGLPLIDYLTRRFTYLGPGEWARHIRERRVLCDGQPCAPDRAVHSGAVVSFEPPPFDQAPAELSYRVIYEDEWLLGIDKPGNLLVHRAGSSVTSNLIHLLRSGAGGPAFPNANIVNRLDRETSGVVLAATEREALVRLHRMLAEGRMDKSYTAVVHGRMEPPAGVIDKPVGKDRQSRVGYKWCVDEAEGKAACTEIVGVEPVGARHSLVRLRPLTGRTHQVRVHLAWLGHPIVGDRLYGMGEDAHVAWRDDPAAREHGEPIGRQALHCGQIAFRHPITGADCAITAPLPADMERLIALLSGPA